MKEFDLYFIQCVEKSNVFNSRHEIDLVFTVKKENFNLFYTFWRFTVSRVTVFGTKRQRIVCDIIPGSIELASLK